MPISPSLWLRLVAGVALCLGAGACKKPHQADQPSGTASASASASAHAPPVAPATDSAPTPAPEQGADVHAIGDTAKLADYHMSIKDVKECKPRTYYKPREGNVWLGVEVSIEATTDKEVRVSPFYARLVDGSGAGHSATFNGCTPELKSSRLSKGDRVHGYITFELPQAASGLRLEYDPFVIGGGKQAVAFTIVR